MYEYFFFFQAEDGIRDVAVTGVQTCALPISHGKIEGLDGVFGYFARLTAPVDFQSVDDLPVDLVFLILSPPDAGAGHLKALASVSRALRDRNTAAKLRGARSRDAIFALLSATETLHAA